MTGGKIYVDAAIRRLVLVVEACDAGKNLTFKELQGRAATHYLLLRKKKDPIIVMLFAGVLNVIGSFFIS